MTAELTIYRCYWPKVYNYLKTFQINNFKTEAFGLLMTIDIEPKQAHRIADILPTGAVVDLIKLEDLDIFSGLELDGLDIDSSSIVPPKSIKN